MKKKNNTWNIRCLVNETILILSVSIVVSCKCFQIQYKTYTKYIYRSTFYKWIQCQFPGFETIGLDTHALLIHLAAAIQALSRILNINSLYCLAFLRATSFHLLHPVFWWVPTTKRKQLQKEGLLLHAAQGRNHRKDR